MTLKEDKNVGYDFRGKSIYFTGVRRGLHGIEAYEEKIYTFNKTIIRELVKTLNVTSSCTSCLFMGDMVSSYDLEALLRYLDKEYSKWKRTL